MSRHKLLALLGAVAIAAVAAAAAIVSIAPEGDPSSPEPAGVPGTIDRNEGRVVKQMTNVERWERASKESRGRYATIGEVAYTVAALMDGGMSKGPAPDESEFPLESTGEGGGYRFHFVMPENKSAYMFTATPVEYKKTGRTSFFVSEDGVVRGGDLGGREATHDDAALSDLRERMAAADRIESEEIDREFEAKQRAEDALRSSVKLVGVTCGLPPGADSSAPVSHATLSIEVEVRSPGVYKFDVLFRGGATSESRASGGDARTDDLRSDGCGRPPGRECPLALEPREERG